MVHASAASKHVKIFLHHLWKETKENLINLLLQFWSSHGGTLVCLLAQDWHRTKWPRRVMLLGWVIFATLPNVFFVKIKESFYYNRLNVAGTNVFRLNVAWLTDVVPIGLPIKFLLILMKFRQSIKRDCASIHLYLCISRHLKYFKYYSQGIVVF